MIPKTDIAAQRRPGLMQIACDVVTRSDIAYRAVLMWKQNPEVRRAHASVADLYDRLVEQEELRKATTGGQDNG